MINNSLKVITPYLEAVSPASDLPPIVWDSCPIGP